MRIPPIPAGPELGVGEKFTDAERKAICATVTARAYRYLSSHQSFPRVADAGQYIGAESTPYRVLRA